MGIPTGLTLHLEAFHRLIAVEGILDGASQHMVNTGVSVSRGRTLEENKLRASFTLFYRAPEDILLTPHVQDIIIHLGQIQAIMFCKLLCHILLSLAYTFLTLFI